MSPQNKIHVSVIQVGEANQNPIQSESPAEEDEIPEFPSTAGQKIN